MSRLDLLLAHLPFCVGSSLSVNRLRKLLQVSHESVERWIAAFERLYLCYRLAPFGSTRIRAVGKERKLYFWDWLRVDDPGARFENNVAGHLSKYCHLVEDTEGYAMELRFLRIPTDARSTSSCSATAAPSSPSSARAETEPRTGMSLLPRADRDSPLLPGTSGHRRLRRHRYPGRAVRDVLHRIGAAVATSDHMSACRSLR